MIRICSPQLGVAPDAHLGGEVYDREILTQLAMLGAEIEVILPAGQPYPAVPNWHMSTLPLRRGYRWFVSNPYFVPAIGRSYARRPFDILRVHSLRFTGHAALWARRLYKLPVPIVAHHHHVDRDRWSRPVDQRVVGAVELIVTDSRFAKEQMLGEWQVNPAKVAVVPLGIDDSYRPPESRMAAKARLGITHGLVMLYVGSLIARKNLGALMDVFERVLTDTPEARLFLIGTGPEETNLRTRIGSSGLAERMCLLGRVNEQEKLAWYQAADVYTSTSRLEGFGLAAGEAMACGLPVVAFAAGSLPELVTDQETGLLAPLNDVDALAAAVLSILNDADLAARMGEAGRARINQFFRWPVAAANTLALYEGLLA